MRLEKQNTSFIWPGDLQMAAVDVTKDFIDRLINNGKAAVMVGAASNSGGWNTRLAVKAAKYGWFYQKVRNKGDWDFKNNVYLPYKKDGIIVCGKQYSNAMPGNFHFGFVGAAAGIPGSVLHYGAAKAQKRAGTSKDEFWCTGGDDPEDYEFIRLGIQLFNDVGLKVNEANLTKSLSAFSPPVCGVAP